MPGTVIALAISAGTGGCKLMLICICDGTVTGFGLASPKPYGERPRQMLSDQPANRPVPGTSVTTDKGLAGEGTEEFSARPGLCLDLDLIGPPTNRCAVQSTRMTSSVEDDVCHRQNQAAPGDDICHRPGGDIGTYRPPPPSARLGRRRRGGTITMSADARRSKEDRLLWLLRWHHPDRGADPGGPGAGCRWWAG
jgi:hypothetical protein